jgi:hypothetical protein
MTIDARLNITPLLIRQATVLELSKSRQIDAFDTNDDPMPAAVQRFTDGTIAHKKTYTTEVRTETTDDN